MSPVGDKGQSVKDVTERIADLEARLAAVQRELAFKEQQLECVRHLVSHDLRAPLRTVDGFGHILREDFCEQVGPEGNEHLERIHLAVVAMAKLLDDTLAFLRPLNAGLPPTSLNLSEMAGRICNELQRSNPDQHAEVIIEADMVARGYERLMHEFLTYVLDNARKFSSGKSSARIEFGRMLSGDEAVYFIRDNGVGFDMQYVAKIFQPFQRLHSTSQFRGNGLGLALAQRIVHHHGGRRRHHFLHARSGMTSPSQEGANSSC